MPLPLPVIPMSIDQFHVMDHQLGWKHEYWDGAAQLSCQETAVATFQFQLDLAVKQLVRVPLGSDYNVGKVAIQDAPALTSLFSNAFDQAAEYAGWSEERFRRSAVRGVDSFFFERSGKRSHSEGLLKHSFAARCGELLVAAILLRFSERGPLVEPIMVEPTHQRRGLSSALLGRAVESLESAGIDSLVSRCHLANTASLNWHQRNGFQELPNYFAANHRWRHFEQRAAHFDSSNQPGQSAEMRMHAEHWEGIAEDLLASMNSTRDGGVRV